MLCKKRKCCLHLELAHCILKLNLNTDVVCTVNRIYNRDMSFEGLEDNISSKSGH